MWLLYAVGAGNARLWGGAERMEVEGVRRDDDILQTVCNLQHSPVAIH